jgi:hypothetical protein
MGNFSRLRCAVCGIEMDARTRARGETRLYCSNACRQRAKRRRERLLEGGTGYHGGRAPDARATGRHVWIVETMTGFAVLDDAGRVRDEAPTFEAAWRTACERASGIRAVGFEPALPLDNN